MTFFHFRGWVNFDGAGVAKGSPKHRGTARWSSSISCTRPVKPISSASDGGPLRPLFPADCGIAQVGLDKRRQRVEEVLGEPDDVLARAQKG